MYIIFKAPSHMLIKIKKKRPSNWNKQKISKHNSPKNLVNALYRSALPQHYLLLLTIFLPQQSLVNDLRLIVIKYYQIVITILNFRLQNDKDNWTVSVLNRSYYLINVRFKLIEFIFDESKIRTQSTTQQHNAQQLSQKKYRN